MEEQNLRNFGRIFADVGELQNSYYEDEFQIQNAWYALRFRDNNIMEKLEEMEYYIGRINDLVQREVNEDSDIDEHQESFVSYTESVQRALNGYVLQTENLNDIKNIEFDVIQTNNIHKDQIKRVLIEQFESLAQAVA
jgi:hypothetical protein